MFFLLSSSEAKTSPLKIAALFPVPKKISSSEGHEAYCITKAVIDEAKMKDAKIQLDLFSYERGVKGAVESALKIVKGNYDLAVGTFPSSEAMSAARIFEKAKIPFFPPTASHIDLTKDRTFTTRVAFTDEYMANKLSNFAIKELK